MKTWIKYFGKKNREEELREQINFLAKFMCAISEHKGRLQHELFKLEKEREKEGLKIEFLQRVHERC